MPLVKVLQTPPRYAPHIGGVEVVAQVIAERLQRDGDQARVVCADEGGRTGTEVVNGVQVQRLRWPAKVANTNLTLGLPWALARADFDVVHTHIPTPWTADVSVLVATLRGRRSVVHFHNEVVGDGWNGWVAAAYRQSVLRLTLRLADVVFVLSDPWADKLRATYPSVRSKLHVMPNGVDIVRYAPPPDAAARSTDLLFVSVLDDFHAYKGLSVLLEAVAELPGTVLQVVGDGSRRAAYEQLAVRLGVADRVRFRGAVDTPTLLALYRGCGTFVLPSQYAAHEGGSSLVVLEALSSGMPVVVAEGAGDIAWQVERVGAGLRVPAADVPALVAALRRMQADPDLRARSGAAGREHVVARHSWGARVADMRSHY